MDSLYVKNIIMLLDKLNENLEKICDQQKRTNEALEDMGNTQADLVDELRGVNEGIRLTD